MSIDIENFFSLGERIIEERLRLGLSQAKLAELCGVSREMVGKYEKGKGVPGGEVLFLLAKGGADVSYILTGQRTEIMTSEPSPVDYKLKPREAALLENYRAMAEGDQRAIERFALLGSKTEQKDVNVEKKKKAG